VTRLPLPASARYAVAAVHGPSAAALGVVRRLPELPSVSAGSGAKDMPRTSEPAVALTFDDGPHPQGTPAILHLLEAYGATATFFLVGEQVRRRPDLAREICARGHEVALHADRHRLQSRLSASAVREDLRGGLETVQQATGRPVTLHRPPYGVYSPAGLALTRELGLVAVLWSRWGKDWRRLTRPERIAHRACAGIGAGDIVLLHDADTYSARHSHERTAAALPLILAELARRELGTVSLV
jgi:peptidoglycan/xylan/chitin deacetylase (PgdA/CDA1 family)